MTRLVEINRNIHQDSMPLTVSYTKCEFKRGERYFHLKIIIAICRVAKAVFIVECYRNSVKKAAASVLIVRNNEEGNCTLFNEMDYIVSTLESFIIQEFGQIYEETSLL